MTSEKDYMQKLNDYFQLLLVDQSLYIKYIWNYNPQNAICYPVNVARIIENAVNNFNLNRPIQSRSWLI